MYIEQLYTGCLAHGAYYIESEGQAAIIDPLRETRPYLEKARTRNAKIRYVLETHFHADFVSGHQDLARASGAKIVYGPTSLKTGFDCHIARDGEEFPLGKITIRLIHTPGHTMESSCFLLLDESGKETAIFTGDTLFIGDVGRPDLAQHVISELTQEKLASLLYDSLRNKIMPLPDELIVYPGHGAGSACGKKMSSETQDTLGHQKATNYALRPNQTREEFITELLDGLTQPPSYFPKNVLMNVQGYESIDTILNRGTRPLSVPAFEAAAAETQALVLDTRAPEVFVTGFIPGSVNIGLDGGFAVWVGTLVPDIRQEIVLVCEPGREEEAITRLARVGYDYTIGFLDGGFEAWKSAGKEVDALPSVSAKTFSELALQNPGIRVLDVRKKSEFHSQHLVLAQNLPLDYLNQHLAEVNREEKTYVHCAGGYRSVIFMSILRARGYQNLVNVEGGFKAIKELGMLPVTDFVSPGTLL